MAAVTPVSSFENTAPQAMPVNSGAAGESLPALSPSSSSVESLPAQAGDVSQAASGMPPMEAASQALSNGTSLGSGTAPLPVDGSLLPPVDALPLSPPLQDVNLSLTQMFLNADPIVQGVMILLFLASVATWVVIIEKVFVLQRCARHMRKFSIAAASASTSDSGAFPGFSQAIAEAGMQESADTDGGESRSDFRERVERSMRAVLSKRLEQLGERSSFLATVGSISPFVGLFGTVWGIMHSFINIAISGETTLAVVAPGIAEALLATAMGLVAAIPAVAAYNKIATSIKALAAQGLHGISVLGNRLARGNFRQTKV